MNVSGPNGVLGSSFGMSNGAEKVEAMGQRDFHSAMNSICLVVYGSRDEATPVKVNLESLEKSRN